MNEEIFKRMCLDLNGKIIYHNLLDYFIQTKMFIESNGNLHHYNQESGYWQRLTGMPPNLSIRSYIPNEYQTIIGLNQMKKIILDIVDSGKVSKEFNNKDNTNLMNVQNGVIDLEKKELLEHNPEYYFDYVNDFNYIKDAKISDAKVFCKYIKTSVGCSVNNSPELKQILEMLGYVISNIRCAEKAFFILGESNTGKSILLKLLEKVFHERDISCVGLHELGSTFRFASLGYSRINLLHELKPVAIKCVDEFKKVVSSEDIICEEKGKNPKRIKPKTVFVTATNAMPNFLGMELNSSIINRMQLIRFSGSISKDEINRNLLLELEAEKDIIFSVAVDELIELKTNNYNFTVPEHIISYMKAYSESLNSIDLFIRDCCAIESNRKIFSKDLYDCYLKFVNDNALNKHSIHDFGLQVRSIKGVINKKIRINEKSLQGYEGIGISDNLR